MYTFLKHVAIDATATEIKIHIDGDSEKHEETQADFALLEAKLRKKMPKGNLGQVEPVPPSRVKTTSDDSCRNKARRKKLARLFEAKQLLRNIDTLNNIGERND